MTINRSVVMWAVGAVVGIVLAVALTWSVSRLAGQRIGLSSVPPSVAGGLVPRPSAEPDRRQDHASRQGQNDRGDKPGPLTPSPGASGRTPAAGPPALSGPHVISQTPSAPPATGAPSATGDGGDGGSSSEFDD